MRKRRISLPYEPATKRVHRCNVMGELKFSTKASCLASFHTELYIGHVDGSISICDIATLTLIRNFKPHGIESIIAVAVDSDNGNMFIASATHIIVIDRSATVIGQFYEGKPTTLEFGINNSQKQICIIDDYSVVNIFNANGSLISRWDVGLEFVLSVKYRMGEWMMLIFDPVDLNHTIKTYASTGELLWMVGLSFLTPCVMTLTSSANYIINQNDKRIYVMKIRDGIPVETHFDVDDGLVNPTYIHADFLGQLWIIDTNNVKVVVPP